MRDDIEAFAREIASGGAIDALSTHVGVVRKHYGDDKNNKPNDHCYWDDGCFSGSYGWNESDESLKKRIKASAQ